MTPEIAIMGHPNEGKSSVLSTLAEDDSVRVSPTPGETTRCRTFPVVIDGREVLRFTDTPGFQNPGRVLSMLKKISGVQTGSAKPNTQKVGKVSRAQLEEIAKTKLKDMNAADVDAAVRTLAGSARSMGVTVEGL